ncbi:hypothetical protein FQZ97_1207080 [compost metagenome]
MKAARQESSNTDKCDEADCRDSPEGCAPAEILTNPGTKRHAGYDCNRQAHEHHGDGRTAFVFRHEIGGNRCTDREEDAMGKGRKHTSNHEDFIAWC